MNIDLKKMVALATEEGDNEDNDCVRLKVLLELKEAFIEYVRINLEDKEAHAAIRVTLREIDDEVEAIQPPEGRKQVHFQGSNEESQVSDICKNSGKVITTMEESTDEPLTRQPTHIHDTPEEENEDESRYKILMLAKAELLRRLEEDVNDADSLSTTLFALEEIGRAEQVYSIIAEIEQTGYEDSDDEVQEEHPIHASPKEVFTTFLEGTHHIPSQSIFPAYKEEPNVDDSNGGEEENLSDLEYAKIGAAKLWECTRWLCANERKSSSRKNADIEDSKDECGKEESIDESTQAISALVKSPLEARILAHMAIADDEGQITDVPESEGEDNTDEWELARFGATKLWEYAQGLHPNNEADKENLGFKPNVRASETYSTDERRNLKETSFDTAEIKKSETQPELSTKGGVQGTRVGSAKASQKGVANSFLNSRTSVVPSIPSYKSKEKANSTCPRVWKLRTEELNEFEGTYDFRLESSSKGAERKGAHTTKEPDRQIPDQYYTRKFDREPVLEGRVFDVGKDIKLTNVPEEMGFQESLVEETCSSNGKTREVEISGENSLLVTGEIVENGVLLNDVVSSNGKSRTTSGFNKQKLPSMDATATPEMAKLQEDTPIDLWRSLRPSHKLKEKVNSKCSRVWKVKGEESNQAWMEKNKSGGKPLAPNKRLMRGWDPPAIYSF